MDPGSSVTISTHQAMVAGAALLPPGGYGSWEKPAVAFHGVAPRTRAQRRHTMNREEVERARLRERRFGYQQYAEPGSLTVPDARDSAMYAADADRFHSEVTAEAKQAREMAANKKAAELERRREYAARESERVAEAREAEARKWVEDTQRLQADGRPALKNQWGEGSNPVTREYAPGQRGEELRAADTRVLQRATVRAQYLAEQGSGAGVDPLTGQQLPAVRVAGMAASLGVPAPAPFGITHARHVNASVMGAHNQVHTGSTRPLLKSFRDF